MDLVVVILAKDEAAVLPDTIRGALAQVDAPGQVHVVADGCWDDTAAVARGLGVRVFERRQRESRGKGEAFAWWLRQTHGRALAQQVIVVLDADSRLLPGCLGQLQTTLASGWDAAQAQVVPWLRSESPIAMLAALSEVAEQIVGDAWRTRAGWPVRLRGTGMALRRDVAERLAPRLRTTIEDAELSLLLAAAGLRTTWVRQARVLDPKPETTRYAAQQRARWLKGQIQLVRAQPAAVAQTLGLGLPGLFLTASILLKPKALTLPIGALACLLSWSLSGSERVLMIPAILLTAWLTVTAASLALAVARSNAPMRAILALLASPLYAALWAVSAWTAMRSGEAWLRSRPFDNPTRPAGEARRAA